MKICDECETVAHCTKHGCIPKVSAKDAMKLELEALEAKYDEGKRLGWHIHPKWSTGMDNAVKAITALQEALAEQPAQQTCNCRWEGEVQVQQCTLHEAHITAIHEWAERAKVAEAKLKEQPAPVQQGWTPNMPITEEMHRAACKVLTRANGLDGTPQRMINAMLAAAPQPAQQDPFGYFKTELFGWTNCDATDEGAVALYEHPPAQKEFVCSTGLCHYRKPLMEKEIAKIFDGLPSAHDQPWFLRFARAIEAAHGIKENT